VPGGDTVKLAVGCPSTLTVCVTGALASLLESVTIRVAEWFPGLLKMCDVVCPEAVPPSSNDQLYEEIVAPLVVAVADALKLTGDPARGVDGEKVKPAVG